MDDMKPDDDDLTFEKILNALLDGKKNLDLKTHINKPKQLAGLKIVENVLKDSNCRKSSGIINAFTQKYLRYMVSYDRLSRKETIRAISEPRKEIESEKSKFAKKLN
ncbi:hypothetical protein 15570_00026 [Lokiarchaeota virus WyrdV1]|nr:hypothetical protein 15570_00026 [Lokiarchaeota virus WyrdV1]